jgi:hypothetical protein
MRECTSARPEGLRVLRGVFFVTTFITAIAALPLYDPVLPRQNDFAVTESQR